MNLIRKNLGLEGLRSRASFSRDRTHNKTTDKIERTPMPILDLIYASGAMMLLLIRVLFPSAHLDTGATHTTYYY